MLYHRRRKKLQHHGELLDYYHHHPFDNACQYLCVVISHIKAMEQSPERHVLMLITFH